MRKKYPSDVTRKQFQKIRPILEKARKKTKPRELDLYDVFCGVLYGTEKRMPMENAPGQLPEVEKRVLILSNLERGRRRKRGDTRSSVKKK